MDQAKAKPLSPDPNTVQLAEHRRNLWHVIVEPGVSPERALEPDFWVHLSSRLKEREKVEAVAADGTWYAEFIVDKVAPGIGVRMWRVVLSDRRVAEVDKPQPAPAAQPQDNGSEADYEVAFGGVHRWRVVRVSDKAIIHKGEPDEASARAWLANFLAGEAVAA